MLSIDKGVLEPGDMAKLRVEGVIMLGSLDDEESDLIDLAPLVTENNIKNWQLKGGGTLKPDYASAVYRAPDSETYPNPVISVEVSNVPNKEGRNGKVILIRDIQVVSAYMNVMLDGKSYKLRNVGGGLANGMILLMGRGNGPDEVFSLNVHLSGAGSKAFDVDKKHQTAAIAGFKGTIYNSYYEDCKTSNSVPTKGNVLISKFGNVGEYIDGLFSGQMAVQELTDGECDPPLKFVSCKFHVKRLY
jgi:hypothetical protein